MKNPFAPRSTPPQDLPTSFVRVLRKRSGLIAIPSLISLLAGPFASAANLNWDPALDAGVTGGAGTWDATTSNWWDGAANVAWPNAADTAIFGGTAGGLVVINTGSGITAGGLTFNTTGYTISGNVPADVLTLAGATPTITVTNATDTATISALLSGTAGLTFGGAGTLVLSGAPGAGLSGLVNVTGGTLSVTSATALGATGVGNTTAVANGATLDINNVAVGTEDIALSGGSLTGTGAGASLAGNVNLLANSTIGGTGTLSVSGVVSGAFDVTKSGSGTVVLSNAANTYSGITKINQGVLSIGASGNLGDASATNTISFGGGTLRGTSTVDLGVNRLIAINAGGGTFDNATGLTLTVSGTVTSGAGNALTKSGLGTLVLGGGAADTAANATAGPVIVNGGVLDLNKAAGTDALSGGAITINSGAGLPASVRLLANNQINDASSITLNSNGGALANFNLNNFAETVGSITMNGTTNGGNFISTGATGVLTLNGNLSLNNNRGAVGNTGREVTITGTGTYGTSTPSGTLDLGGAVRTINVGTTTPGFVKNDATIETLIQNGGIIKNGTQTLNLLNNGNTYAGGITVNEGLIAYNADGALGNVSNTITLNGGGVSFIATGTHDPAATRIFTLGASGGTFDVTVAGSAGKIYINDAGQITGAGLLTKTGAGVLQIGTANTGFTGGVTIASGTIEYQNADALGTAVKTLNITGVTGDLVSSGVVVKHNINLTNGGIISSNSGTNNDFQGTIDVGTGGGVAALRQFQTVTNANSFKISGPITGAGNLTATAPAAATLTLTGSRAGHTGQVIASTNATVAINNLAALAGGGLAVSGGTVAVRTVSLAGLSAGTAGLNATYYNFGTNPGTGASNFAVDSLYLNQRTFSRTDSNVNLINSGSGYWPTVPVLGFGTGFTTGGQQDGVMWKGLINITNPATYQFSGTSDDNYVLIIDGVQIGTLGVISANTNIGAGVPLTAGAHSIVVKHTQGTGGGYATLSYNGGVGSDAPATVLVPASAFTNGTLGTQALGPIFSSGGTIDIAQPSSTSALSLGAGTLTLTSATIENLTAASAQITASGAILAPTTTGLIVTGGITESSVGLPLTMAGPYFAEFQGTNSYTGLTTVTGGQLRLNATGGNAIAGNLMINAPNAAGPIANVQLHQSNQIANTSSVTLTTGILDVGAFNDTIANLTVNGGSILGTGGILTVGAAPTLNAGYVGAGLGGNYNLVKSGTGTVVLAGAGTFTGVTNVNGGVLQVRGSNALGAGGAGNESIVASGASLQMNGSANSSENVTVSGTGLAGNASDGALRALAGVSSINNLTSAAAATVRVDSGELIINGALNVGGGAITKTGAGTLTFATNQATVPAITLSGGALGFSGTQSFGAATIPAGRAYQFNSDPGAGVSITAPAGTSVIGNYAVGQSLLSRIAGASTGNLALTGNSSTALDFTGNASLSLGAVGNVVYGGTLTPGAGGYRLGGNTGRLQISSVLSGSNALEINGTVQPTAINSFTGGITVNVGGRAVFVNSDNYGTGSNVMTLNGGTLQITGNQDSNGGPSWTELGNQLTTPRVISIGAGGGTIDIPARQGQGNFAAITGVNGLTGSGALTKTGLGFLAIFNSNNYSGALTLAVNSNRTDLRASGALPNVTSVTINNSARLDIDNNSGLGTRQYPNVDNRNRLNDAATIQLNGGTLRFASRNGTLGGNPGSAGAPATSAEYVGATTIGLGQAFINSTRTGGGGADLIIANLLRTTGSGTVNFTSDGNTLGQFGDNPRIILTQVNTATPTASAFIGGWATINQSDFAAYGANATIGGVTGTSTGVTNYGSTNAPTYTALTAATAPGLGGFATGNVGTLSASAALGAAGAGQNFVVRALKFNSGTTAGALTFAGTTGTPDTLYIESGGIITDNGTGAKSFGVTTNAFTRGRLTAGLTTATTPQELFFHNNTAATLTVNSTIIDNPNNAAATVKVVKAQDGTVVLDGANSYTGGTAVFRGTLTVNTAGGLGGGGLLINNGAVNLANPGSSTGAAVAAGTPVIRLTDQGLVVLTSNAGVYNSAGDRFSVGTGSIIYANNPGLNSLTRVASETGMVGGDIFLSPGAIVKHNLTNTPEQGAGSITIKNLGTNADLFYAPGAPAANNFNQTITVGAGTPWAGLSSSRSGETWAGGAIFANGDFTLQGLTVNGGITSLNLGSINTGANLHGGLQIVNNSGGAINANIVGAVSISEDEPVNMPSNLTFVLTAGSTFQPNTTMAMGYGANQAKILVQAGGTLDPGGYTNLGATTNSNKNLDGTLNGTQGLPYALPSPVNGQVTVEAGGRFLINDTSGIGSAPNGSYTLKTNSILDLGSASAFLGRGQYALNNALPVDTTGLANPGQFVFEPGVVVKLQAADILGISQFVPSSAVYELFNANRSLTGQTNPFIIPAVGTPTVAPENVTIANGGMLTNDGLDRQLDSARGRLLLGSGAVLAATTQTFLNVRQSIDVASGGTLTFGSTKIIDGLSKLGTVQLNGPQSNVIPNDVTINVVSGTQIAFGAANVWPDTRALDLPTAVTFPIPVGATAVAPGTGTSLLLNVANFMEYTGPITGNGTVMANNGNTALGMNIVSGTTTSNVVFKLTNGQSPSLMKAGAGTLILTGNSDSQGLLVAQAGTVVTSNGTADWVEVRPQRGASIVVNNSVNATNNRLGTPTWLVGQGGTFEVIGHATTPVQETFSNLATGSGNFVNVGQFPMISTVKITPGAAKTTLQLQSMENFTSAGQRWASYIINSPTVGNLPLGYTTTSGIVPAAGNSNNGLVELIAPVFSYNGTVSNLSGGIFGAAGTSVMGLRNDLLGDANNDGVPEGLVTQDGVNYTSANTINTAIVTGLNSTAGLAAGMLVTGTGVPAGTRILSVDSGSQVTLNANSTAAITSLNVIVGGLRNLASSEYSSTFRDHQTVGLNVKLSGTNSTSGDTRIQSLTLTPGSTLNLVGTLPNNFTSTRLLLNSSAVFVQPGGTATINGSTSGNSESYLQFIGGSSLFFHTWGDLNLNTKAHSDVGLIKTGPGTLNFGPGAFQGFRGAFQLDGGTVNLAAGNSVQNVRSQNGSAATNFTINAGTLNLNGNSQEINGLNSANELPGQGGTITSATAATILNIGGGRFAGALDGAISLDKAANNTLLLTSAQTYTGTTTVRAGTLQLRDSAALSASAGLLAVRNATLLLDNSYLSNVTNRINPATPVILNGGTVTMTGAAGQLASQTFNTVTLESGRNTLDANVGGSGANEITIGNLVRTAGGGSVLNISQTFGFTGTAGNNSYAARYFINNVNGTPLALNDGIIGGWAIVQGSHFATYRPSVGIGAMANTGDGFANYDSTDVTTATATQNVNDGTARTFTTSKTINSWRMAPTAGITNTYNNGVGLTVDTGGLLSDANFTINHNPAADARGNFITSNSGELFSFVNQSTNTINIPITGGIDLVKSGTGTLGLAASSLLAATVTASATISTTNTAGLEVGDAVSNGTASVFPAGTYITAINPGVSITLSNAATTGGADYRVTFGNSYTGKTIVNNGTLTLNQVAVGTAAYAVPGDLYIMGTSSVVTENGIGGQINPNSNIVIGGGGRFNAVNAAGVTETLNSLTFLDGSGSNGTANFDRTGLQLTSQVNFSAPIAVTSTNTNPATGVPFFGGFAGSIGFTNNSGTGSTLFIDSGTAVNGVLSVGLRFGARIPTVPTSVAGGGLIKAGPGLLTLDPDQTPVVSTSGTTVIGDPKITGMSSTTGLVPGLAVSGTNIPANSYVISVDSATQITINTLPTVAGSVGNITAQGVNLFNNPSTLTEEFNITSGIVRADRGGSLGGPMAITTVQSGAVLLGANNAGLLIPGSITLKDGSTLAATISSFSHGAPTDVAANQTVLNVPSGNVHIAAYDYFVPSTNNGNITFNGKLTGAGTINMYGPQVTQGNGGGGVLTFANPFRSGAGAGQTDFTGTFNVGTNAILQSQIALIAKNVATAPRATGNPFGIDSTINLNGGRLRFRDDATFGTTAASNTVVTFGNKVTLSANSYLDAGRQSTTDTNSGNIISLGILNVPTGSKTLTVDSNTATTAGAGLGNYITRFASIDGAGDFVKGGTGRMDLTAIAGTFTGSIGIAGPQYNTLAPTFNIAGSPNLILPTTATFPSLKINGGYITEASKTINLTGSLNVNANVQNTPGSLALTNTTTLTANSVVNNGIIGATGGTATITSTTGFSGAGHYLTFGQQLNLAGAGISGSTHIAGDNVVNATATSHNLSGVEIQSGTLKLTPTATATTVGNLTVIGSPASTASATTAAIAPVAGVLNLDGTTGSISHTGNITNSGLVRASVGTTTVSGTISGTTLGYTPGLLEGVTTVPGPVLDATNSRAVNPGNFGIRLEPRMLQTNAVTQQLLTGHADNDTWIYTGYVKDNDGVFSFAQNIDDRSAVWIDGVLVLNAVNGGTSRVVSTAFKDGQTGLGALTVGANLGNPSQNFGAGITLPGYGSGWHLIEIRMNNGTGGSGPIAGNGFGVNYGFGYKDGIAALDGADMIKPIDNGTGNLFVTPVGGKGNVQVDAGATLSTGGITMTNNLTLAAAASPSIFTTTGTAASDVDNLITTGTSNKATVKVNDPAGLLTVNTGLTLAAGTTLKKDGLGTLNLYNSSAANGASSALEIAQGTVEFANNALLNANIQFSSDSALRWKVGNIQDVSSQIQPIPSGVVATVDTFSNNVSFGTPLSGDGGVNKAGSGTLTMNAVNTYTGKTSLTAGTLLLGADNVLPTTGAFSLSGGKLSTGGFDASSGLLSLTANSVIDFGSATSILTFAGNTTGTWSGVLSIWNWNGALWSSSSGGAEQLNFTSSSLTSGQLASIQFYSDDGQTPIGSGADFLSGGSGELVPVPEPGAILAALLMLGAIGYRERRRRI